MDATTPNVAVSNTVKRNEALYDCLLAIQESGLLSSTVKKSKFKSKRLLDSKDPLNFLTILNKALHSNASSHPVDTLAGVLSDQQLKDALETSFVHVLSPCNPALSCCLRAVKMLLSRVCTHWKVHSQ